MADRKLHNLVNKLILGNSYEFVNALMDSPSQQFGSSHRKYLHNPLDALFIAATFKDPKAGIACLIHQGVDHIDSAIKKKIIRNILK